MPATPAPVPAVPNEELARVAELISMGMMDDEREFHE
jgi:hypothetical protein